MRRRTFVLGMSTAAVGGSVLLGSGSFSEAESQRNITIETVGDEDAYLVLQYQNIDFDCAAQITLLTVTNHFPEPLGDIQVAVSVSDDSITISNVQTPDSLDVGESGMVTVDAVCETAGTTTATVEFDVDASGDQASVEAEDRSVEATCTCEDTEDDDGGDVGILPEE